MRHAITLILMLLTFTPISYTLGDDAEASITLIGAEPVGDNSISVRVLFETGLKGLYCEWVARPVEIIPSGPRSYYTIPLGHAARAIG